MRYLILVAAFIFLVSCSSNKKEEVFFTDTKADSLHNSAKHYYRFIDEVVQKKISRNMRSSINLMLSNFKNIEKDKDSLQTAYILKQLVDPDKELKPLESRYIVWISDAQKFVKSNFEKEFKVYDDQYNAQIEAYVQARMNGIDPSQQEMFDEIKAIMSTYRIPCLDIGIADSGCLWVYTIGNGRNRDGLAQSLCYTASKYSVKCVTIFDKNQNELGRSLCK